jgi:tetratricopeptide (TPR) repeat protein
LKKHPLYSTISQGNREKVIQVLFFLRFRTQLQKTREENLITLESGLVKAFEAANGGVHIKERYIAASFNEKSIGIWPNIICVLETGHDLLRKNCPVSVGAYAFVICKNVPVFEIEDVCRTLASLHGESGIWCDVEMKNALSSYCTFENKDFAVRAGSTGSYVQIKHIEAVSRNVRRFAGAFPLSDKIVHTIKQEFGKNIVFSGPDFIGKREGIYRFCALTGNTPPLILRFRHDAANKSFDTARDGGANIGAFADMISPKIHAFLIAGNGEGAGDQKQLELLDTLKKIIFRERLRNEYSPALAGTIRRFLRLLVDMYVTKAKAREVRPVIVVENVHNADPLAVDMFLDIYNGVKFDITAYGTCTEKKDKRTFLHKWEAVFSRTILLDHHTDIPLIDTREMSVDLWGLSYTFNVLRNFFPGYLFPRLFEEAGGGNPSMLIRVFAQLARIGVIDCVDDPLPRIPNFTIRAEWFLGDRKDAIYDFIKTCLLQAVSRGRLSACFDLIETLAGLHTVISDTLLWNALCSDVLNGTTARIHRSITANRFDTIVGKERGPAARYLFLTFNALIHGDKNNIQTVFSAVAPDTASALYEVQILINRACYYAAVGEGTRAFETLKKVLRIHHEQHKTSPAKVFRLIALVKLHGGKWGEVAEYITIAVEHAEKQGTIDELAVSSYYAANIYYLLGDLPKAERLAHNAEHNAVIAGCNNWTDRARFLRGKLRFEFGFYQDALHLFEKTFENLSEPITDAMKNTMSAWIFRAKFFSNLTAAKPDRLPLSNSADPSNLDLLLFKAEASYISGSYETALEFSETIAKAIPAESFLWTERPDWSSGFAQGELLNMSKRDFWGRKASIFHSLALSAVSKTASDKNQAIKDIDWLTPSELPPGMDTYDSFYFYALYRVLRKSGAPLIDINTVVGTAIRRLQQRGLKIDDTESRRGFLNRPYWNNALVHAAKEYMLI